MGRRIRTAVTVVTVLAGLAISGISATAQAATGGDSYEGQTIAWKPCHSPGDRVTLIPYGLGGL